MQSESKTTLSIEEMLDRVLKNQVEIMYALANTAKPQDTVDSLEEAISLTSGVLELRGKFI